MRPLASRKVVLVGHTVEADKMPHVATYAMCAFFGEVHFIAVSEFEHCFQSTRIILLQSDFLRVAFLHKSVCAVFVLIHDLQQSRP